MKCPTLRYFGMSFVKTTIIIVCSPFIPSSFYLSLLDLAQCIGFCIFIREILWPRNKTIWREAAITLSGTLGRVVCVFQAGVLLTNRGCFMQWAPAFDPIEFWQVGMEVNPYHCLFQFWVSVKQIHISMNKRLQYLQKCVFILNNFYNLSSLIIVNFYNFMLSI